MKRFLLALAVFFALPASAGVFYRFVSATSGVKSSTLSGTAKVDGGLFRMDLTSGDGLLFKDGAVILSPDSGRTLQVLDVKNRTYYELRLEDLLGEASVVLKQFGGTVNVANERVRARDAGSGGTLEGYATRRHVVDTSYNVLVTALGEKMDIEVRTTTQSWNSKQLPSAWMNVFQIQNVRTGIAGLDRLIAAQSAGDRGFPLKQITSTRVVQRGLELTSTTTASVSEIRAAAFPAGFFVLPAGFRKVDGPIARMMKSVR